MVTASEPGAGFTASAQSTPSSNTLSHARNDSDKTLAVLLTHISNSHATLVGYLDHHAKTYSAATTQAQTGLDLASAGLSTSKDNVSAWDSYVQEASEPMAAASTQASPPLQLLPYQQELADCIMAEGNSVVFLPSGTGQVIVAASVTQQMLVAQPQKHVIYLTDRVHLLYQQAAQFSSQLGRPVGRYCTEASWHNFQAEFQTRQVLFFPASLYLTLLQQGVADLAMVSLLIMDEVHQATKEHPMSSILKEFHWNLSSEAAPKLVGLVGSPGKGKHANFDRVRRGITDICGALKASMVTPLAHLAKLEERLHQAQVEVHRVEAGRSEGNLLYLLHVYCDSLSRLLEKHGFRGFGKLVPAANSASYISFMADAHWAASARMPSNLLLAEAVSAAQEAGRRGIHPDAQQWVVVLQHLRNCCQAYRAGQELGPSAALGPLKGALTSLQTKLHPSSQLWGSVTMDLLQQLSEAALFQELCSGDMHTVPGLMTSSRLNCLMHLLTNEAAAPSSSSLLHAKAGEPSASKEGGATQHSKPDEEAIRRAVIYVGGYVTAQRLLDLVSSDESAMSSVWQPVVLPAADSQQRRGVLADFGTGKTNMLIAVAGSEQYGQIAPCSLVVRFDCLNTVMALSHSRDACLALGGKCVLFFDSAKQETELDQLRKEERLVKAVCQMVMGGNSAFEEALLKLDTPDPDAAVQARAVAMLDMFCLDCSGLSPEFKVTEQGTNAHTASVQLPAGCHISASVQGPVRPDAVAAKAAAAWKVLQQLHEPGHLAAYWASAALLQQAGVEGGVEGGEVGSEAVLWRCEVCGVPATSARNLEDHYKGYKHQRLVARHKAALHCQGYHHPHTFDSSPHRMPFTPSHHPPGPHPSDAGFLSPVRSPYSHSAARGGLDGAISELPAHAYDMYIMPPSPMTPMMRSHPGQQLQQSTPPYHMRHDQLNSPGAWGNQSPYPGTPASFGHMSPQRLAVPSTYAATPGSNQPYTCFVCNATATSKKNYIAHLQGRAHVRQVQRVGSDVSRWQDDDAPPTPAATASSTPDVEGSSPYECSMCGVYTSSQALLESHVKGRRHLKRALEQAHADAADLGLQPTPAPASAIPRTPTATHFYCEVCGVFATSEEQLVMHNEGKKHKRTVALKELTHGHLAGTPTDSATGGGVLLAGHQADSGDIDIERPASADQQLSCALCHVTAPTLEHLHYHLAGQRHRAQVQASQHKTEAGSEACGLITPRLATDQTSSRATAWVRPLPSPLAHLAAQAHHQQTSAAAVADADAAADDHGDGDAGSESSDNSQGDEQTDAVVTPRRDLKFGSTDSGKEAPLATVSAEASTLATASDAGKGNAASAGPPAFRRAVSFSHESHVWQPRTQAQAADGQYQPFDGSNLPDGITAIPVVDPDDPTIIVMQFFCRACGIATTSEANLQDHLSGRKHARRVQHLAKSPLMQPAFTAAAALGGEGLLSRKSSGNVYDNFPCVKVGDYNLPSSMDLRQYLDEMQEVGDWEGDPPADLPTIPDDEEAHHPIDTDAALTIARLNSCSSFHRRRRSGSGSGALLDMSRVDAEGGGGPTPETSPQSSRGFIHKYKGSMDARSFQQHAARVADLTDALLAERAANKPPHTLTAKPAAHPPASSALSAASLTSASHASPQATPSSSPDRQSGAGQADAHHSASVANQTGTFKSVSGSDVAQDQQHGGEPSEGHMSKGSEHAGGLAQPALTRDNAQAAASTASTSAGPTPSHPPPATEGLAGSLGGTRGSHYCTICNVATTSAVHLQTHYMGSKHQRRLAQMHNSTDRDLSPYYCSVCAISATSAVHLQLHLSGRAHQRKAKLASEAEADYPGSRHSPAALAQHGDAGYWEPHRDGMTPGTIGPHDQDSSRPNSGRSSAGSGRHHAEILPGSADAHSSPGNQHDDAARSGDSYMAQGSSSGRGPYHAQHHRHNHMSGPTPVPPNYPHFNGRSQYPHPPAGQQYMQARHHPGMLSQGMPGNGPAMLGAGPQGIMSSALGVPQRRPFSTHGSHPGSMPQGIVPINGSIQSPMHYMGYFPTPYFAAQSAGPVPVPGFMPQPWCPPPAGPLPRPNGLQLLGGRPVPMMHASSGMSFASPMGYQAMSGACVPVS
ncbi:hypothetical protein WJX77_002835 [Trebouxia sp. C0004]